MATQKVRDREIGPYDGRAVDSSGELAIDPTTNVLRLVEAAVKRIDDMAELREEHAREVAQIRETNIKETLASRESHSKELSDKEVGRLDSIRQVDQTNQASAAKAALDAIQALATTTTTNADNIRNALNATAAANAKQVTDLAASIAASTAASFDAMATRIAALEKANAEGVGKGKVTDPQLDALMVKVDGLAASRNIQTGSDPAIAETLQTILKTQSSTATEIATLRDARNTDAGKSGVVDPAIMDALKNLNERVTSLAETRSATEGKSTGSSSVVSWVVAGVGVVIAIITLLFNFLK